MNNSLPLLPSSSSSSSNDASKKKKVKSQIPAGKVRVTIKFITASGWEGTKQRDFPGRYFLPSERDLLREWALQFRNGYQETNIIGKCNLSDTGSSSSDTNNEDQPLQPIPSAMDSRTV